MGAARKAKQALTGSAERFRTSGGIATPDHVLQAASGSGFHKPLLFFIRSQFPSPRR